MKWLLTLLLLLVTAPAWATTYHVSNTATNGYSVGSDANACTALGSPCLTIAGGIGKMSSGDTLTVNDGTYSGSFENTVPTGTSESVRTIIQCRVLGTIRARSCIINATNYVFRLLNSTTAYITIQGFDMRGSGSTTVVLALNCTTSCTTNYPHHISILNNDLGPCNLYCLYTGHGTALKFNDNRCHDADEQCIYNTSVDSQFLRNECDSIRRGGQCMTYHSSGGNAATGNEIAYNSFHDNTQDGGFSGPLWGTSRGIEFGGAGQGTANVHHNVCYNMPQECFRNGSGVGSSVNNKFEHNTCYNTGGCVIIQHTGSTGTLSRNNIALTTTGTAFSLCGGCGTATDNTTTGTASAVFTNLGAGNFSLKAGAVAIDDGTNIGGAFNGAAPDHGAFETFTFATCSVETGDASTLRVTFNNNVRPPLLPTNPTGFTARKAGANDVITARTRMGDNRIDLTLTDAIVGGNAVDISYSGGNLTDSSLNGGTVNQPFIATLTNQSCTNNVSGAPSHVVTQAAFRWHGLRGNEAAPVIKPHAGSPENTNISVVTGGHARVRIAATCTSADCPAIGMALRYSCPSCPSAGTYTVLPDVYGTDNVAACGTSPDPDIPMSGDNTTSQLSTGGTFVPGAIVRSSNAVPTVDLALNGKTELEYCISWDTDAVAGYTYDFRLYDQDAAAINAYTVTPRATIIPMTSGGGF